MQKINILFIIHCLPYPLNSGGCQAIFNGIFAIKDDFNIFVTYPEKKTLSEQKNKEAFMSAMGDSIQLMPFISSQLDKKPSLKYRLLNKFASWLHLSRTNKPLNPYSWWMEELKPKSKPFINHVDKIITNHHIDIVQCEMLRNLPFVLSLPTKVKKVFVHHELGFVRHQLELEAISSTLYDGKAICLWSKCLEISLLNQFDCVVTLSPTDSRKLIDSGVTTNVFESFAIVRTSKPQNFTITNPQELSFVGPDTHKPNLIGLKWFLDNCWPILMQANKDYHLRIIGKWSEANISAFLAQYPNVSFLGFVEDLKSALQGTIMIVPITIGSGIRMKILEASSLGIPFVSTSIGAEGIPIETSKHCLIADNPFDFVEAIIQLKDKEKRFMFTQNAYQLINEKYSLPALRKNRIMLYSSLFEARPLQKTIS